MDKKRKIFLKIFFLIGDIITPIAALYVMGFLIKYVDGFLGFGAYFIIHLFWSATRGDLNSLLFSTPQTAVMVYTLACYFYLYVLGDIGSKISEEAGLLAYFILYILWTLLNRAMNK